MVFAYLCDIAAWADDPWGVSGFYICVAKMGEHNKGSVDFIWDMVRGSCFGQLPLTVHGHIITIYRIVYQNLG